MINRAAYLEMNNMGKPLNLRGRRNGWKNNVVTKDGYYMPVYWYPTGWGRLFKLLFQQYLEHSRPQSRLPWLFLTEAAQPMTAKAYAELHNAAVSRIGLLPRKNLGTTPHGHRHAYGQRLQDAADRGLLSQKTIQLCLHHNSVLSQKVYTERSSEIINDALVEASNAMTGTSRLVNFEDLLLSM
jgi:integrase